MKKQWLVAVLLILSLLGSTIPGLAYAQSTKKQSSDQLTTDPEFNPRQGTYYYDVFWQKVKVGKATITIMKEDDLYKIIVSGKTKSKVSMFYKARYRGEVQMEPDPLKPIQANITEQAGRKKKHTQIRFPQEGMVESTEVESIGDKKKTEERTFSSETFILDPFSTVFLVRHLDWHVGMAEVFDIFTGKKHYEVKLLCDSIATLEIDGKKREAWVIIPYISSLDGPEKKTKSEFKVYLSKDARKKILKIEGAPRIGKIVALVRKFEPLP